MRSKANKNGGSFPSVYGGTETRGVYEYTADEAYCIVLGKNEDGLMFLSDDGGYVFKAQAAKAFSYHEALATLAHEIEQMGIAEDEVIDFPCVAFMSIKERVRLFIAGGAE